ncbi:DUF2180 family protein [Streptomyces albicerus]|uniref:DUF2180 family protein n=1 Tax=Streptomyces albicerus TaxID=2569859 RepID=UPI00298D9698|nr:DUF2180 family protein [Streptomyces albicerus]
MSRWSRPLTPHRSLCRLPCRHAAVTDATRRNSRRPRVRPRPRRERSAALNCYDCQTHDQPTTAVATCSACGAGICHDHARAVPHTLHRLTGMGVATKPRTARRLLCGTCAAAETSA